MSRRVSREKECYCHTCGRALHSLGIMRHRAMHRDNREDCEITFTNGQRYRYRFSTVPAYGGVYK